MIYRRRASALHAARAAAGSAYCLSLAVAALALSDPLALGAVALAILGAGAAAGVARPLMRAAAFGLPVAVAVAVINALVSRSGLTVIVRLGDLPLLGHTDITLQAAAYGAILGLRALALILAGVLYTTAVDPDEMLRLTRRVSFRSALTATLATRMVPVLIRDGRRLADAQRCRPGAPATRAALLRTACSGMLDRALDVAAALEVRGYGGAHPPRSVRSPWSRHDLAIAGAAAVVIALTLWARLGGAAAFNAYPAMRLADGPATWVLVGALIAVVLAPFADRRGVAR